MELPKKRPEAAECDEASCLVEPVAGLTDELLAELLKELELIFRDVSLEAAAELDNRTKKLGDKA